MDCYPVFFPQRMKLTKSEVTQSCLTLCDPMDCSLPGSSIHGIFQVSVLEWVAISFSKGSSQPRDLTQVSCIANRCFTIWATSSVQFSHSVMSDSLWPHESQHARPPCPPPTPGVHQVSNAIQPSHPLLSPFPPAPNPSQHQSLFQWGNSSHEVAKVVEFQL